MSYKDTLAIYDELVNAGCDEVIARAQAKQLGEVAKESDTIKSLLKRIDRDLLWMRIIGAAMTTAFVANGFLQRG